MRYILQLLFFTPVVGLPQTLRQPVSASYTRLGAYSLNHVDVFSSTGNPASISQLKNTAMGVHGERRYMLNELNNYNAVIGTTTKSGNFGLQANYFGFSEYKETRLGLVYGRKLGNKIDVGALFNYNAIKIPGYGNSTAISFEVGTVLHLTERIHAGWKAANPTGGKFGKNQEEKLSSLYAMGLGYEASEKFFVSAEIEKEEDQPVNVNAGMQYKFLQQLLARAGISTSTSSGWFGIGLSLRSFRMDVITNYHPQLGITTGLLLLFSFKPPSPKGEHGN